MHPIDTLLFIKHEQQGSKRANAYNHPWQICKWNLCLLWQVIRKIFFQD